jgi:hypothetical protein
MIVRSPASNVIAVACNKNERWRPTGRGKQRPYQ